MFDQNISPRLVDRIGDLFPGSEHVHRLGLDRASDHEIWGFARLNGYTLVTKDADFGELVTLQGFPPKVIWIRLGNCTTARIEETLRRHYEDIRHMGEDDAVGILSLS